MYTPTISILLPGLSNAVKAIDKRQKFPALTRVIARSRNTNYLTAWFETCAFKLFGLPVAKEQPLAVAPVSYFGMVECKPRGWCMSIDPVSLDPRRSQLFLIAGEPLSVTVDEAEALISCINEACVPREWRAETLASDYWYLTVDEDPDIVTTPLSAVFGEDIDALLPRGSGAAVWQAWMNEVQMVLHQSPVNQIRDAQGRYPINSVWPWGAGRLPDVPKQKWATVWSNEPVTRGLAKLSAATLQSVPTGAPQVINASAAGPGLVVLGDGWSRLRRSSPDTALTDLATLENDWWPPLWQALKCGDLSTLSIIDPDSGVFEVHSRDAKRWWARASTSILGQTSEQKR